MAKKQLDKLVANEVHSLEEYKLKREHVLLEFLMKDSAIDQAPSLVSLVDGDSIPILNSSQLITTPRSISWGRVVISNNKLISIGDIEVGGNTNLSIDNRTPTTLDILSSSGTDVTVPQATTILAGLMTAANLVKLDGIEALADVTDKENIATSILASLEKIIPADNDYITILNTSGGNVLSRVLWSNVMNRATLVSQVAHGFIVGDTIRPAGSLWVKTRADSAINAGTVGVVSEITSANSFKYITEGIIPGAYIMGANYFLSTTNYGGLMIVNGGEVWSDGQIIEYIGTGVSTGLHVQVEVGQEISNFITIDKYVSGVSFDNETRILSLERTDGLSTLTVELPQYVEVDTLHSVLTRGNSSALGATFGSTVTAPVFSVDNEYTIYKNGNRFIMSAPYQIDMFVNNTSAMQIAAGGNINVPSNTTTSTLKITTGAQPGYIWTCTNTNGNGIWVSPTSSRLYRGTWNANTNTPLIANGSGTAGWYYRVTTAGTWNGIEFFVGDDVIYNGTTWERIPGTSFTLQVATASVLGGVKIGSGVTVQLDGTISVSTNYQAPLSGTGLVYSTAGVISYDTSTYGTQAWVTANFAGINHNHDLLYVPLARNINTVNSLTGGGNLSADRTISLVNDELSPGNNFVYGTDSIGVKGWQQTFWLEAISGTYFPNGYVAIGDVNPIAALHIEMDVADEFLSIIKNTNTTGNGMTIIANDIAFEVKDKDNITLPAFQILSNGIIKWQLAQEVVGNKLVYYNTVNKQLSVGPVIDSISLTSLSAISPILYNNLTGVFSMEPDAYAPFGTVSFPGFGTNHTTAAYGDHVHSIDQIVWNVGTTGQYWRGDKTWQTLNTAAVAENTNLYFTTARSRSSISLTTTGTSGVATYSTATGILNVPDYSITQIYTTAIGFNPSTGNLVLTRLNAADLSTSMDGRYSLLGHSHNYETSLGNPVVDDYILASTTLGVRYWVNRYSHPAYSVNNITATAGQIVNTFINDSEGHVTAITLRSLLDSDIPTLPISKITDLDNQLSLKQPLDGDLTAIAAISSGSGLLRRTGITTWVLDTTAYLDSITYAMVINALGFVPEPALGNPASGGYVLTSTVGGIRSWMPIPAPTGGTVTSVSAGAGMNFPTFGSYGAIALGTPSTITTTSGNVVTGTTHSHVLNLSGRSINTQYSLTGGGNLSTDRTLNLVGDVATPAANYYYGTNGSAIRGWYLLPSGGGGSSTADNGLTKTLDNIRLGGFLVEDTTINGNDLYSILFNQLVDFTARTSTKDNFNGSYSSGLIYAESWSTVISSSTTLTVDNLGHEASVGVHSNGDGTGHITLAVANQLNSNEFLTTTSELTIADNYLRLICNGLTTEFPSTYAGLNVTRTLPISVNGVFADTAGNITITVGSTQIQSDWTQVLNTAVDYIKNKPVLATVATTGSYNDLLNKPTIPGGNNTYLGLGDTSDTTYVGKDKYVPMVDATNNELDLAESVISTLLLQADFPASYTGSALKLLRVNAGATAIEFVTDGSSTYADAKVSNTAYNEATWIGVTTIAPSKDAIRNQLEVMLASIATLKTEDIAFEFADVVAGTAKDYTIDIKASYGYTIESAVLETDNGTLTGVSVKIGAVAVTSLSAITVDTAVDETASTGAKTVFTGDRVWLSTSTGFTGTPTLIRGKLKIIRT